MLTEPASDPAISALDRAVFEAVRARLEVGARSSHDADAISRRTLLDRASPTERAVMQALWGRMATGTGLSVVAAGPAARILAADRWGAAVTPVGQTEAALSQIAADTVAIIDIGDRPWWGRLLARRDLRVVAALPDNATAVPHALVVSQAISGPTGQDRTFWISDSAWPDARIVAALADRGLGATLLTASGGLKLFMLAGYVQAEDGRLSDAPGSLSGVIGSAPIF